MKNATLRKPAGVPAATGSWHRSLRRHALWAALTLALGVSAVQAQTVADGGTHTNVIAAPNGVPVVDIAAPNGKGLSHNTYQQFNVGSNGLILNNSGAVSNTQLAGYIGGNPNLSAGQAASLILNEVTSTAPSQLNGAMEVAGRAAQVVVANPNGITCSGCGFINAPRGTLTTARPLFAGDGSLSGLAVTGGTIAIEGPGLPGAATDQVDLLARAVAINAGVWARQLNVVTGPNRVDFATLATQPLSATGAAPSVALDVSALGGMYANAIRLVGTEAGLGVNSRGEIIAQNGDLTLTSAGQVVLAGKTTATGNVTLNAAQSLTNQGTLAAGKTVNLTSGNLTNSGVLYGNDAITLSANGAVGNSGQIEAQGDVTFTAAGVFDNAASGSLYAGGAFGLTAASLGNAGILESARGAMLRLDGAANNRGLLQVDAGDFVVQAAAIDNGGTLSVGGNAALDAAVSLGSTGTLLTGGQLTLTAPRLVTSGTVQAGTALTLRGDTLTNDGKLYALGGGWAATLTGAFANQADGDVYASRGLAVQAGCLTNTGGIEARQFGVLTLGGDFRNSGRLQTDQADLVLSAAALANTGTLSAFGKLQWRVDGIARNSGLLVSGGAIDGTSGSFANLVGGQLQSGAGLALAAADLSNAGSIGTNGDATLAGSSLSNAAGAQLIAAGALTLGQTGIVGNAGVLQAGTDLAMTRVAVLDNAVDATVYAGRDIDLGVAGALTNAGMVYAANTASLAAGSVANTGTLRSAGSLSLAGRGNLASSGAIQAQRALNLQGGGDFANSGKLYAIDGVLDVRLGGAFNATANSDVYGGTSVMFGVGSFANDGMLEAKQAAGITAAGDVGNRGTLQVDDGDLVITGGALSNQGTLSAAGATQLTSIGSLVNDGQLVTSQALGLVASNVANSGQIRSGGDVTLQSAAIVNSGLLQAGDSLAIRHNTTLTNQAGGSLLAAWGISADTSRLLTNAGTIQAGGNLAVNGAGAVDNLAGATLYGTQFITLRLGGGLHNAGAVYGTQGVELMVDSLDNAGSLRSGAALDVATQADAGNAGTVYAVGPIDWNLGGALANTGVLAANGNVTLKAASLDGNGTLAAGLQADGTLGGASDLAIATAGNLAAPGRSLAAGELRFAGSAIDLSGSQTRAGNVTLAASQGDVANTDGDLAANGTLAITTRASLVNGGATAAQGGKISAGNLVLHAEALDNRHGSLIQTGADDLVLSLAGTFTNANGTLATNARNLILSAVEVDNTAGAIRNAGDGTLTITTPGDLTNIGGRIAGNGALALQASGALGNAGGLLSVAGNVTAIAGSFDNMGGTLIGQYLDLAVARALTNTDGGTIQAGGALQLDTGSLDNTGGAIKVTGAQPLNLTATGALTNGVGSFIGGNGAAMVSTGSLVNAGQIYAGGMLGVTTHDRLANDGGALQAQGEVSIVSGGSLDNRGGRIEAGNGNSAAGLNLRTASLDNTAGRIANVGQGTSTFAITQDVVNQGGTLGGQGAVVLTAVSLDNSQAGKLVAGQALMLGLDSLDNTDGSIYAASDLDWVNTDASLQNARGSLQSGSNLSLDLAVLDNTGGTIATNQNGNLSLGRLTGLGTVAAGQDLVLTLGSDYTNVAGSQLSANHDLTLNVAGNFGNAVGATLQAVNRLAINAASIANAAGATLNGTTTALTTGGALTNEGSIEGGTITLDAGSLTNTANIIGGALTVTADSLTNGADLGMATDNNPYQSALIAAANSLDLYVSGTLLNRDAVLFTLGNLTIGAGPDPGYTQAVTNLSGDIEAGGNVAINAGQFTNQRRVFQTTTYYLGIAEQAQNTVMGEALARYLFSDANPNHQPPNVTAAQVVGSTEFAEAKAYCDARIGDNARCIGYPNGSGAPTNFQSIDTYAVTAVMRLQAASAQSKLLAGGDVTLNGSVLNDASTIAAGNNLVINGQDGGMGGGNTSTATVRNVAWAPTAQVVVTTELQTESQYLVHGPRRWVDGGWWTYGTVVDVQQLSLAQGSKPTWVTYDAGAGVAASMTAGNAVSITARTIDNTVVDASGNPVQAAISLGANGDVQAVGGTAADVVVRVAGTGGSTSGVAVGGTPDQVDGVPLVLVAAHDASSAPVDKAGTSQSLLAVPQVVATLVGPNAEVRLPQSDLYTVKVQPGSPFLVETNPRFAQYSNLISSDYLLQQLGLNPAQTRQRLGDGFYEQQLVLDQITGLTGRRYLADNTDALNQYRTLLGNAVEVARQFDLAVGVALTPEQMAGLTRDIVWLVDVTVDGHQVLQPVVYLSTASAQSLTASGATMAGKNVILTASGDITNNGTIAASQDAQLTASNLLNSGMIGAGNDLSINAAQDILNGGTIRAGGNVSLVAGNDVLSGVSVAQSLGSVNLGGLEAVTAPVALPGLALPGSITAGGNLLIGAGRDLGLDIAPVAAGADLSLAVGRDLTATATAIHAGGDAQLLAGRDLSLLAIGSTNRIGTPHDSVETTTHTVDTLSAGGTLSLLAGHDLMSQGAHLAAGNSMNLTAINALDMGAVLDSKTIQSAAYTQDSTSTTAVTTQTARGTNLTAANDITLNAGHALSTEAATIDSNNGAVNLWSGGTLNLGTATETNVSDYQSVSHGGGLFSSKTITISDHVVAKNAVGSVISGDTVNLRSQGDMTLAGATVAASNGLSLASAGAITIGAATNTRQEDYQKTVTTSGLLSGGGIGITVGERTQSTTSHTTENSLTGSIVGTLAGNSNVSAKTSYTQVASSLLSKDGNVSIQAGSVNVLAGLESEQQTVDTLFKQSGFTLAVGGGALGALEGAVQSGSSLWDTVSASSSGRVGALTAANAAVVGYQGYQAASGLASQLGSSGGGTSGLSVSLTYGESKATTHSVTHATQAVGSAVSGQNVSIIANGANDMSGDATITGSSVHAAQNLDLVATHNLTINAAQNTYANTTTNKSESGSIGVAASIGQSGMAFGVTASAALGHGKSNTDSVQQVNSQVSAGNALTFVSGADTTLAGAVLSANQVQGEVGGNLTIQSLQDTLQSHSTQTNVSASATVGYGASASASYNHSSAHADYANVAQQSGIEAGNGGFQLAVGHATNLIGGSITSSPVAIDADLNTLTTGTLATRDLQNVSDGSASTMGLGASFNTGATFGQELDGDPGNDNYLAANGGNYGLGRAIVQNLMDNGSASSSSSGQTLSAISASNIQVRDVMPDTAQTIATLEANARTATNTQAAAPDVAALQQNATDEQTGNQLLFNVGSWATDQGALKDAVAAVQAANNCNISSGGKDCQMQPLSGNYGISNDTSVYLGINGIMNDQTEAGNNIGDMATLFTNPSSAGDTTVLNVYSPKVSLLGSLLAGAWNAINANVFGGSLGAPAGSQAMADVSGQISSANRQQGAGINLTLLGHSDGTSQTVIGMEQNPNAFAGVSGNSPLQVILAEPSANVTTAQSTLNALGVNAGIFYSASPTDPVPTLTLLGNNKPTEANSQGYFTAGSLYYGNGGVGLSWGGLTGASVHSDPGYSAMVIPAATLNGQTVYTWGFSGNPNAPGNAPKFNLAPDAPTGTQALVLNTQYGGIRNFGSLLPLGMPGATSINMPTISVAGSTVWNLNIASLVWPGGAAANLGSALSVLNGMPNNVTSPPDTSAFAPGASAPVAYSVQNGATPGTPNQPNSTATPAQQRCLVLTGGSSQCLQ